MLSLHKSRVVSFLVFSHRWMVPLTGALRCPQLVCYLSKCFIMFYHLWVILCCSHLSILTKPGMTMNAEWNMTELTRIPNVQIKQKIERKIVIIFFIHQFKCLFWVFKRTIFLRPFFWVQTSYVLFEKYYFLFFIIHSLRLRYITAIRSLSSNAPTCSYLC